jgi:hypothetical protein
VGDWAAQVTVRSRRLARMAFGLAVLLAAAPAPAQPLPADADYVRIAQAYFAENFHDNPSAATEAGVHTEDDRLDDPRRRTSTHSSRATVR